MKLPWLLIAASLDLPAAIIHGVVIERATQRPLARSRVRLQMPTAGGGLRTVAEVMANRSGNFWFPSLAAGQYLLTASRAGYLEARYGQTRPTGPGTLIVVKGDDATFAELRLPRLGAITGLVLDENRVGLADVTVIAYPAVLPLRMESSSKTDDRGVFRIGRLKPGRYWVRTAAHELDDKSGLLPTFYPLSTGSQDARIVVVDVDRDEINIDIQPIDGRLFSIRGMLQRCPPDSGSAKVVLSSDTGTKETMVPCLGQFEFSGNAPNKYEIYAEPVNSRENWAAFTERSIDQTTQVDLAMSAFPSVVVRVTGSEGQAMEHSRVPVNVRRKSLAGGAALRPIWDPLGPGYWEVFVTPPPDSYLAAVSTSSGPLRANRITPLDLAPEIRLDPQSYVRIDVKISGNAATVEGVVKQAGEPAAAAPVFLYPLDADVRRRMHGHRTTVSGLKGEYRFEGLAPGRYLILSSWDLDEVDESTLTAARAQTVVLGDGQRETLGLSVWEQK